MQNASRAGHDAATRHVTGDRFPSRVGARTRDYVEKENNTQSMTQTSRMQSCLCHGLLCFLFVRFRFFSKPKRCCTHAAEERGVGKPHNDIREQTALLRAPARVCLFVGRREGPPIKRNATKLNKAIALCPRSRLVITAYRRLDQPSSGITFRGVREFGERDN